MVIIYKIILIVEFLYIIPLSGWIDFILLSQCVPNFKTLINQNGIIQKLFNNGLDGLTVENFTLCIR